MQEALAYYAQGREQDRLAAGIGLVELLRTQEILADALPAAPCVVADIGGGPGRYALWLAGLGYVVEHRDLVPLHVEQLRAQAGGSVSTAVADARALDLAEASADAVLLLGPLYHLYERADRHAVLSEAARIARPGAPVLVAAISRWAPRLDGLLVHRIDERYPDAVSLVATMEADGVMRPLEPHGFCGYTHRPEELRQELAEAGLRVEDLVSVEGLAFALPDIDERMADPIGRDVVLGSARALQRVPELLGIGPHLLATARRL